jgi:tetratricopeptide (TPR) repeat protein
LFTALFLAGFSVLSYCAPEQDSSASGVTDTAEEPALPVISNEPEIPDVQEGLTGNEPALPSGSPTIQAAQVTAAAQPLSVTASGQSAQPAATVQATAQATADGKKHYDSGRSLMKSGQYAKALDEFTAADKLYPKKKKPESLSENIAKCKKEIKKSDAAFNGTMNKASAALKDGRFKDSITLYSAALKSRPDNEEAKAYLSSAQSGLTEKINELTTEAAAFDKNGQTAESVTDLRKILEIDPGNASAAASLSAMDAKIRSAADKMNLEAVEKYTSEDYEEAIAIWQKVLILTPNDEKISDNIKKTKKKMDNIREMGGSRK